MILIQTNQLVTKYPTGLLREGLCWIKNSLGSLWLKGETSGFGQWKPWILLIPVCYHKGGSLEGCLTLTAHHFVTVFAPATRDAFSQSRACNPMITILHNPSRRFTHRLALRLPSFTSSQLSPSCQTICYLLLYLKGKVIETEEEKEEDLSVLYFMFHIGPAASAGEAEAGSLKLHSGLPCGAHILRASSTAFPGAFAGIWIRNRAQGHEPAPI